MGNYTGTIRLRDSQANTSAALVESFNAIHAAITGCGMTQVNGTDFTGQAGTFVTTSPGSGETQVTIGTTTAQTIVGYKVYKHPTLSIYLRVEFYDIGYATTTSRSSAVRYSVGTALSGGGFVTGKTQQAIRPQSVSATASLSTAVELATYSTLYASCGSDHFWIYSKPCIALAVTATSSTFPHGISSHGIGVFTAAENSAQLLLLAPPPILASGAAYYGRDLASAFEPAASRYWTYDGSIWTTEANGCAGFLFDPFLASNSSGVRIGRAEKYIGGSKRHFNIGFLNGGAAADGDLISVDLLGSGASNYRACHALGPSSHAGYMSTAAAASSLVSVPLLPWAA